MQGLVSISVEITCVGGSVQAGSRINLFAFIFSGMTIWWKGFSGSSGAGGLVGLSWKDV